MKKVLIVALSVLALCVGATAHAAPGEKFVLTKADYPIYVNGVEYRDENLPPLNYGGKTYIPLSKIGDILGVEYKWNAEKKRVEVGVPVDDSKLPASDATEECLYVTNATGKYAGYLMLHGYPEQDKFQIYFKVTTIGSMEQYHLTYEDLRGINLNQRITWKYGGNTYTHTRSQLYGFFADTRWFKEKQFRATWIGERELERTYGITATLVPDPRSGN